MLTAAQLAAREGKFTASFAPILMDGDDQKIFNEWLKLIGDPSYAPENFDDNWPVQWGSYGEPFILNWHERMSGQALTRRGEVVNHPRLPHVCCTLDAYRAFDRTVLDCKVSNAYIPLEDILNYYTPQLIVQRACVECDNAAVLLVHGSAAPQEYELTIDPDYERVLWQRVEQFWQCVLDLRPPVAFPRVVPPEQWISIDLDNDSACFNWSGDMIELLTTWDANHDSGKLFESTRDDIKKLLPNDVGRLIYKNILIARNRAGAMSIKRR